MSSSRRFAMPSHWRFGYSKDDTDGVNLVEMDLEGIEETLREDSVFPTAFMRTIWKVSHCQEADACSRCMSMSCRL